jgi:hypothetical protein
VASQNPTSVKDLAFGQALSLENNELEYSSRRTVSDELGKAGDIFKALGCVMIDEPWREIALVAFQKVLGERAQSPKPLTLVPHPSAPECRIIGMGVVKLNSGAICQRIGLDLDRLTKVARAAEVA